MQDDAHRVILGKFASVYGVKGWIKVISYTSPIDNILDYPDWQVKHAGQWHTVQVEQGKPHGKFIIVKLKGDDDRDQVRRFTNNLIAVPRAALPDIDESEHYIEDLIGMQVIDSKQRLLGSISDIFETGANDVICIKDHDGKQHLIPFLDHVVKEIDATQKRMIVDWDIDWEHQND